MLMNMQESRILNELHQGRNEKPDKILQDDVYCFMFTGMVLK